MNQYFNTSDARIAGPTRSLPTDDSYKLFVKLWLHNQKIYAVTDASVPKGSIKHEVTQNTAMVELPVQKADSFYQNLKAGQVAGSTLLIDFPFPAFPDNMGHWAEVLAPAYSCLSLKRWTKHLPAGSSPRLDAILLINLSREDLQGLGWVHEMLYLTVAPAMDGGGAEGWQMPPIIFMDDLDAMDRAAWLSFERLLVPHDRYSHSQGLGGFATPEIGTAFRRAAYAHAGITFRDAEAAPKTIIMLTAVGGEPIANAPEVVAALQDAGRALGMRVRPYSVTAGAPFASFVGVMARTGILISRHGPLLANVMFLPPGAMVLELLPYNWDWRGISEIYVNLTRSIGDVHHFAWRARHPRWALYPSADEERYADWTAEECSSSDCLEVHARAHMVVDSATVQEMIMDLAPGVFRGASVPSLAQPWPSASHGLPVTSML
ncbi:hypothetical protein WJX73_010108 [Symbiochloris irregularis]|uniref:Glycosyltransferase family 61 protein n=1 Tax=Symbiochloris irregularis TaxID=706552 RepID=A0AAW1NYC2_9CHLO